MSCVADSARLGVIDSLGGTSKMGFFTFTGRLWRDIGAQARSPFHADAGDAAWFGAGTISTVALFLTDQRIDDQIRGLRDRNRWISSISPVITEFGGNYGIAGTVMFAGYAYLFDDGKGKETAMMLGEALITSGLWARVGKLLTGRERPSASYSHLHPPGGTWYGPFAQIVNRSHRSVASYDGFPSGHTATAFSIATIFAEQYDQTPTVPIIAYTAASIIGISRIVEHAHWSSDVLVGACLGYLCARQVVSSNRRDDAEKIPATTALHTSIYPDVVCGSPGIGVTLSF